MKEVKVLGAGCAKCATLLQTTVTAVREMGMECDIEKVTDLARIMNYGVISTPALVIDGEVKAAGRVPGVEEIKEWLA